MIPGEIRGDSPDEDVWFANMLNIYRERERGRTKPVMMVIAPAFFLGHGEFAVRATSLMCLRRAPQNLRIPTKFPLSVNDLRIKNWL
jgi:hypothetical protein